MDRIGSDPIDIPAHAREHIHGLWDALAGFGAARIEETMRHVLAELSVLLDAGQAYWLGSVRLSRNADPLGGWRPAGIRYLHPPNVPPTHYDDHCKLIEKGEVDPSIVANVAGAGTFRINIKHEIVPPEWFQSAFHATFFAPYAIRDVIYMVMPLGEDIESWFGFQRIGDGASSFGAFDRALLEYAGRPLKWFHRLIALHYGLFLAEAPLTPSERRVLACLLGSGTEGAIAAELGLTPATVHTYATRIYRKFNVQGRAGLAALWLGQ